MTPSSASSLSCQRYGGPSSPGAACMRSMAPAPSCTGGGSGCGLALIAGLWHLCQHALSLIVARPQGKLCRQPHRLEAETVQHCRAVLFQRGLVLLGCVAFMMRETVLGKHFIPAPQAGIPFGLGQDGSRRDALAAPIAVYQRLLRKVDIGEADRVEQQVIA